MSCQSKKGQIMKSLIHMKLESLELHWKALWSQQLKRSLMRSVVDLYKTLQAVVEISIWGGGMMWRQGHHKVKQCFHNLKNHWLEVALTTPFHPILQVVARVIFARCILARWPTSFQDFSMVVKVHSSLFPGQEGSAPSGCPSLTLWHTPYPASLTPRHCALCAYTQCACTCLVPSPFSLSLFNSYSAFALSCLWGCPPLKSNMDSFLCYWIFKSIFLLSIACINAFFIERV